MGCADRSGADLFNAAIRAETRFTCTFNDLVLDRGDLYFEPTEGGEREFVRTIGFSGAGVYLLWRYLDYCQKHAKEVYEARYVGKSGAELRARLMEHFEEKEVGLGGVVHVTGWSAPNRQAKYVEQLLLDTFAFALNKSENRGRLMLRIPVGEGEWD